MGQQVSEVGRKVLKGTTAEQTANSTPASFSLTANVALSSKMPAAATRVVGNNAAASTQLPKHASGVLEATLTIEGTATCRYRVDGVAATTSVGNLVPAPATGGSQVLVIRGEDLINGFNIIGTGNTATVYFTIAEMS